MLPFYKSVTAAVLWTISLALMVADAVDGARRQEFAAWSLLVAAWASILTIWVIVEIQRISLERLADIMADHMTDGDEEKTRQQAGRPRGI